MRYAVILLWARHLGTGGRANLIFNQAGENQVSAASLGLIQVGKSRYQVARFATRAAEIAQRRGSTFDKDSEIKDFRVSPGFCRKEIKVIKLFKREKPRQPHCATSRPKKEISPNELMDSEKSRPLNCLPRGLPMTQKTDARAAIAALAATSEGGSSPTGLPVRTAQRVLGDAVRAGLLASETPKGRVSLRFPLDALETLFPRLYPQT